MNVKIVFIRSFQAVFQSGHIILHSHQQRMRVPIAPHPHQHLTSYCWIFKVRCMFWVRVLYQIYFANSFSQSVACLLILQEWSFVGQKFSVLMTSSLSIMSFTDCAFDVVSKSSAPYTQGHLRFLLCYLLSFIVLCYTFRSTINFEVLFVKDVRSRSRFTIFPFGMWISSCLSTICWKDYFCSVVLPLSISLDCVHVGLVLSSTDLYILLPITHCLDFCSF